MKRLLPAQNAALGALAGTIEVLLLQPMLYCKNAAQQSLPLSLDPRVLYRGVGISVSNMTVLTAVQFPLTGALSSALTGGAEPGAHAAAERPAPPPRPAPPRPPVAPARAFAKLDDDAGSDDSDFDAAPEVRPPPPKPPTPVAQPAARPPPPAAPQPRRGSLFDTENHALNKMLAPPPWRGGGGDEGDSEDGGDWDDSD